MYVKVKEKNWTALYRQSTLISHSMKSEKNLKIDHSFLTSIMTHYTWLQLKSSD